MIETEAKFLQDEGRYEVQASFNDKGRRTWLKQKCRDDQTKEVAKKLEQKLILRKLTRYVNHRDKMMHHHGAQRDGKKLKAVQSLRNSLVTMRQQKFRAFIQHLFKIEDKLETILPGKSSRFYDHDERLVNYIMAYARAEFQKLNAYAD